MVATQQVVPGPLPELVLEKVRGSGMRLSVSVAEPALLHQEPCHMDPRSEGLGRPPGCACAWADVVNHQVFEFLATTNLGVAGVGTEGEAGKDIFTLGRGTACLPRNI